MQYYTILTDLGKQKILNCANGGKINLTKIILGDSNGTYYEPDPNQTSLKNKIWEGNITNISIDNNPTWIKAETVIPSTQGGFCIRELGILDDTGTLIAIGNYPYTYKPTIEDGSIKELYINIIIQVSDTSAINLTVNDGIVYVTKKDFKDLDKKFSDRLSLLEEQIQDQQKIINNNIDSNTKRINAIETKIEKIDVDIAILKGQGAKNIFLEKFENLDDINLQEGIYDKKNKRVVI